MKKIILLTLFATLALFFALSLNAKTIEIDVHGMTCAFCVDTLNRTFNKIAGVTQVQISMKTKKIRIETASELPRIEMIKQAVLDAGFTPTKVTVFPDEKDKK